jgi:hypothetical protein
MRSSGLKNKMATSPERITASFVLAAQSKNFEASFKLVFPYFFLSSSLYLSITLKAVSYQHKIFKKHSLLPLMPLRTVFFEDYYLYPKSENRKILLLHKYIHITIIYMYIIHI